MAVGCLDVMLVNTVGENYLLELKEEVLDLTFYSISLTRPETPTF